MRSAELSGFSKEFAASGIDDVRFFRVPRYLGNAKIGSVEILVLRQPKSEKKILHPATTPFFLGRGVQDDILAGARSQEQGMSTEPKYL